MILASRNAHKLGEVRAILGRDDIELAPADLPEPVEDGLTFEENALIKARAIAAATGEPCFADDSGICVDAMNGAPGIFSARWAGSHGKDRENLELLLGQMAEVKDEDRAAQFVCVAVLAQPDGSYVSARGVMPGRLLRAPQGEDGFGYDPIFAPEGYDCSAAELSPEDKNAISHRGTAFRALAQLIG